jgi:N-acetylneuraminate synthase
MKIDFASTPYSSTEAEFLIEKCQVPYIKVASMELDNIIYLEYLAKRNYPTILSTGMGTIEEIEIAVEILKSYGNKNICILHCVSLYPTKPELVSLQNILNLRQRFPEFSVGFSDHTEGFEFAIAATALGASVIEKHFTLDKSKIGMDNQMATEYEEMSMLVSSIKKISVGLGTYERSLSEEEFNKRKEMRRSFVTKMEIAQSTEITMEMLDLKRPGNGIRPNEFSKIIGKRAKYNLEKDVIITEADLE